MLIPAENVQDTIAFLDVLEVQIRREEMEECGRITEPPKLCECIRIGILGALAELVSAVRSTVIAIEEREAHDGRR